MSFINFQSTNVIFDGTAHRFSDGPDGHRKNRAYTSERAIIQGRATYRRPGGGTFIRTRNIIVTADRGRQELATIRNRREVR